MMASQAGFSPVDGGGLETDLVDGRRRGGDGGAGDFLLNCLHG